MINRLPLIRTYLVRLGTRSEILGPIPRAYYEGYGMGVPTHLLPRPKSDAPGIVTMKGEMAGGGASRCQHDHTGLFPVEEN